MKSVNLTIIGSGPAGYTAAIYASRAKLEPVLYSGLEIGGQLMYTTDLENYPGFPQGIKGPKFMMNLRKQSEKFGTKINDSLVTAVDLNAQPFKIWTQLPSGVTHQEFVKLRPEELKKVMKKIKDNFNPELASKSVIIATGAVAITLGVPGEQKFFGRGVSVCAVCDAAFYRDKKVYVIGGGDSAMEDALALTNYTSEVYVVHRRDELRASKVMQERVLNNKKIKVLWNHELRKIKGDNKLEAIILENNTNQVKIEHSADGLFYAIGHRPQSALFIDQVKLDKRGFIITNLSHSEEGLKFAQSNLNEKGLVTFPTQTNIKGVFAAGDVVDKNYQQAITAAGMGAQASLDAERWLASIHD